jgi:HSP20 family protein
MTDSGYDKGRMRWENLRELRTHAGQRDRRSNTGWSPVADVCETDVAFVVVAELPGVVKGEVEVSATPDSLTIHGVRCEPDCEPAHYVRLERGHGRFARHFSFAARLDVDGVQADFADGVLTVTLPKAVEDRGRRVDVE